ncbi:Gfo/Idh/MocA family oxidoreductase [Paenibacillus alba]|uniref:Gfo/Idh/MocA family protein n=1 Tax=Paenibacillus alba TaxID=1197127 RepID=UPI001564B106|nr:Gfo/Idh/MocA family oxidoreductase [Paenibacillus alba]NQX70352.1 Gfo/Idh/MocA family oxidoreductase [Paenibacillus alba]
MEKIKVIQIGLGGFGKFWLGAVLNVEEVELVAVVDMEENNLAVAAQRLAGRNIPLYQDHKKALREVKADLVLLITPPHTHRALTIDAVEAGMHVIMEKPVSSSYEDALEIYKFAQTCGKYVMVNQNYRRRPVIQALKACVDAGKVGTIENVEWRFSLDHKNIELTGWRRAFDDIMLKEMSIHHFDSIRYILGKNPISVYAESMNPTWSPINGDSVTAAVFNFEDGVFMTYFGSWVNKGKSTSWNGDIILTGSQGAIELKDDIPQIVWSDGTRENIPIPAFEFNDSDYLEYSIGDMVNAIRERRLPATHIGDNLISWSMACSAADSTKSGMKIKIEPPKES